MKAGEKTAFVRLVMLRGRHPVLALHDLNVSAEDFVDAIFEDQRFAVDALTAIMTLHITSFEERFPTDTD